MGEEQRKAAISWKYCERDVILYALSVGCAASESRYVYENDNSFSALPTFGVLTLFNGAMELIDMSKLVPNFNPMKLLHGEQFFELRRPFPTSGTVVTTAEVIDVLDKGKAALIVLALTTKSASSGEVLCRNEVSTFLRGSGGFGATRSSPRLPEAIARNEIPKRAPDAQIEEDTQPSQAALYRLNGDNNPLHIDQDFAAAGGFPKPILHGLCTFGIAAKHVLKTFGGGDPAKFKSIKVVIQMSQNAQAQAAAKSCIAKHV